MLTIKKRSRHAPALAAACLILTACGPPGIHALHKGDRMIQSGKYDDAIESLMEATNLLAKDALPVRAKAQNLLGLAYQHLGYAAKARECYEEALALDRNAAAEANYNLGCLELSQNNLAAAKDALTTYTSLRGRDWNAYMTLGLVDFRLAMRLPANFENLRQTNFESARRAFENSQLIRATAVAWNNLALIELLRKPKPSPQSISNAVVKFKNALVRDPRYAPALFNLAVVYDPGGPYKYGDVQAAIDAYRRYLSLDPPPPPHASEIALLVTNMDRTMRFTMQLPGHPPVQPGPVIPPSSNGFSVTFPPKTNPPPRPSPLSPTPPPAPVTVPGISNPPTTTTLSAPRTEEPAPPRLATGGSVSNTLVLPSHSAPSPGAVSTAALTDNSAAQTNVPLTSTAVHKPSFLSRLFGGKPKPENGGADSAAGSSGNPMVTPLPAPHTVVHYAAPPVSTNPGNRAEAERYAREGAAAEKESHWKDAVISYDEAVKADPAYYDACEALGMAAIKSEEYAIALEALHHALLLDPESANARYGYAWVLAKKDFYQDAAGELEKLLAHHPDEIRAHLLLGNLYAQKLGQPDFARGHYQKVLEQDPYNDQAAGLRAWLQNNPER